MKCKIKLGKNPCPECYGELSESDWMNKVTELSYQDLHGAVRFKVTRVKTMLNMQDKG